MHGTNIGYSVAKIGNSNLKMVERTERGCATKGNQRAAAEFSTYRLYLSPPQKSRWQMEAMRAEEYGQPYPQGAFKIGSERASKLQREKKTARQVLAKFSEYLAVSEYREPQAHGFPA